MDTCADAWIGRFAWDPGADPLLDIATRPYSYAPAAAYIGNELLVNGRLYNVEPELTDQGRVKTVTGFSYTVDAVDSHVRPPYERSNVTLEKIANDMCKALSIQAIFEVETGGKFARTTGHESDSIFVHLSKLATERGILITCTPTGNMLFWRAKTDSKPVGTLEEGKQGVIEWKGQFDGRKRFHAYHCITAGMKVGAVPGWGKPGTVKKGPSTITEIDPGVPLSRFLSFRADDTTPGNILDAARWRKNRQIIDALTQTLPVTGWYAPNGKLWEPNTTVTVVSATLGVPRGYDFLIRAVEFMLEERREAVLHLIPPAAYTGKDLSDIWTDSVTPSGNRR
jgi:prophage tail gpP-like protein